MKRDQIIKKLDFCEKQFKLALGVSATCHSSNEKGIRYLTQFAFGRHVMDEKELSLTPDEEKLASVLLEHSATYVMVTQLNQILEYLFPNRLQHEDHNIRDAAQIIRLIRNAFAHDPFSPTWRISSSCKNQIFRVENIISLNTKGLDGKSVNRMDYGGPISLLRLLQFLKQNVKD